MREGIILRENQKAIITQTKELIAMGHKKIIIKAPTGAGKTIIQEELQSVFKNVLITTPRINLTHQTALERKGWGIIQGNFRKPTHGNVTVGTLQTILNLIKKDKFNFAYYGAIFIDECHINATKKMGDLIKKCIGYGMVVIGFTATPFKANGDSIEIWQDAQHGTPKLWQGYEPYFKHGYLVPPIVKQVGKVDRSILHATNLDYTEESQLEAIADSQIDVVSTLLKYRRGATLIVCVNIEHAEAIYQDLISRGERAIITHSKNDVEVSEAVALLKNGSIDFGVSIGTMHTGTDIPNLETIALARLTKSKPLLDQLAGRGARCWLDKRNFLFLDMFGTCTEIGLPFEPLLPTEKKESKSRKKKCKECGAENSYILVDIEENDYEIIETHKCKECGNEDVKIKSFMVESCEHCHTVQRVGNILSFNSKAVFKCSHCGEYTELAELTPAEMVVTFANREQAIRRISEFAKEKLSNNQELLERFLISFGLFAKYAQLDHLSAIMDYVGDFKAKYSIASIEKVIWRMDGFYSTYKGKQSILIDGMFEIYEECNYELEEWAKKEIIKRGLPLNSTLKGILSRMREKEVINRKGEKVIDGWSVKNPISDTKKYKTIIKRFLGWLEKKIEERG